MSVRPDYFVQRLPHIGTPAATTSSGSSPLLYRLPVSPSPPRTPPHPPTVLERRRRRSGREEPDWSFCACLSGPSFHQGLRSCVATTAYGEEFAGEASSAMRFSSAVDSAMRWMVILSLRTTNHSNNVTPRTTGGRCHYSRVPIRT